MLSCHQRRSKKPYFQWPRDPMTLRHRIHNEISAGRLKPQWTCGDLKENSRLSSRYKQSSLGSTPANQSRSAPGLNLEDGKHSEDYYYYVRVGKRGNALLFELRPDALEPFTSTAADIEDFPSDRKSTRLN